MTHAIYRSVFQFKTFIMKNTIKYYAFLLLLLGSCTNDRQATNAANTYGQAAAQVMKPALPLANFRHKPYWLTACTFVPNSVDRNINTYGYRQISKKHSAAILRIK
jgi:hypothetical protein